MQALEQAPHGFFVVSCVGSVQGGRLRLAAGKGGSDSKFMDIVAEHEIVSLTGTIGGDGGVHLHVSLSNQDGAVVGGHVVELVVFTTAEIMLAVVDDIHMTREEDPATGFKELEIRRSTKRALVQS